MKRGWRVHIHVPLTYPDTTHTHCGVRIEQFEVDNVCVIQLTAEMFFASLRKCHPQLKWHVDLLSELTKEVTCHQEQTLGNAERGTACGNTLCWTPQIANSKTRGWGSKVKFHNFSKNQKMSPSVYKKEKKRYIFPTIIESGVWIEYKSQPVCFVCGLFTSSSINVKLTEQELLTFHFTHKGKSRLFLFIISDMSFFTPSQCSSADPPSLRPCVVLNLCSSLAGTLLFHQAASV